MSLPKEERQTEGQDPANWTDQARREALQAAERGQEGQQAAIRIRCRACRASTAQARYISGVGHVCNECHKELNLLGRFIEYAEHAPFPQDGEAKVHFRQVIRGIQQLDLEYRSEATPAGQQIEIKLESSVKHLLIRRFREQQPLIASIMSQAHASSRRQDHGRNNEKGKLPADR